MQDCSISIANALEILQSCTKPSVYDRRFQWGNNFVYVYSNWSNPSSTIRDPDLVITLSVVRASADTLLNTLRTAKFDRILPINPLAPGRFQSNFRYVIFKLTLVNGGWEISHEIALRWMPLDLIDDKSTLVQLMAWCRQAASHYLSQCWPRSMSPNGVTRPQWVKSWWRRGKETHSALLVLRAVFSRLHPQWVSNAKCWCFLSLNKLLYNQSSWRWLETPQRSCVRGYY